MRLILEELNDALTALNKAAGTRNVAKGISLGREEVILLANLSTSSSHETGFNLLQRLNLKIIFLDSPSTLEVW